jgi:hypothetical protein
LDFVAKEFRYTAAAALRVSSQAAFPQHLLLQLNSARAEHGLAGVSSAHLAYLGSVRRVCFRGPEALVEDSSNSEGSRGLVAEPSASFLDLNDADVFPFIELRSAAPIRHINAGAARTDELQRRIASQLDTLTAYGIRHAVLSAWGCGCFGNAAQDVAAAYALELKERLPCFDNIVFAILSSRHSELANIGVFREALNSIIAP